MSFFIWACDREKESEKAKEYEWKKGKSERTCHFKNAKVYMGEVCVEYEPAWREDYFKYKKKY